MALHCETFTLPSGLPVPNAYIRAIDPTLFKQGDGSFALVFTIAVYVDPARAPIDASQQLQVVYAIDGANPYAQAYTALMERWPDAVPA